MTAFSNVLVGIDFGRQSVNCVAVAAHLAEISDGRLTIAFVSGGEEEIGSIEAVQDEFQKFLTLLDEPRVPIKTVIRSGNPAAKLEEIAMEIGASVIVVAASDKDALERLTIGSTCEALVKRAQVPILVVREPLQVPFQSIAAAIDYSRISIDVLSMSHALAYDELASLFVLHVNSSEVRDRVVQTAAMHSDGWFDQYERETALSEFDRFLAESGVPALIESGIHLTHRLIGTPWKAVCEHARQHHVNLIVMGRYRHGVIREALIGSNADKVVRHAPCSVLVMHRPA